MKTKTATKKRQTNGENKRDAFRRSLAAMEGLTVDDLAIIDLVWKRGHKFGPVTFITAMQLEGSKP